MSDPEARNDSLTSDQILAVEMHLRERRRLSLTLAAAFSAVIVALLAAGISLVRTAVNDAREKAVVEAIKAAEDAAEAKSVELVSEGGRLQFVLDQLVEDTVSATSRAQDAAASAAATADRLTREFTERQKEASDVLEAAIAGALAQSEVLAQEFRDEQLQARSEFEKARADAFDRAQEAIARANTASEQLEQANSTLSIALGDAKALVEDVRKQAVNASTAITAARDDAIDASEVAISRTKATADGVDLLLQETVAAAPQAGAAATSANEAADGLLGRVANMDKLVSDVQDLRHAVFMTSDSRVIVATGIFDQPTNQGRRIGTVDPTDRLLIVGEEGKFYRIVLPERGFVPKLRVR